MALQLSNSAFVRVSAVMGVLCALSLGYAAVQVYRNGDLERATGWTAAPEQGNWFVRSVAPGGPADGFLLPGDRVLAIDGNRHAARIGPAWILRDNSERTDYSILFSRNGAEIEQRLAWPIRRVPEVPKWLGLQLFNGLVYLGTGLLITFTKPDSMAARRAVLSSVCASAFFTMASMNPASGVLSGWALVVAMIADSVRPWHVVAGYRFTAWFPLGDSSTKAWRRFEYFLYGSAFLLWIPNIYGAAIRMLGPETAVPIVAAQYPFSLIYDLALRPLNIAFTALMSFANTAVCWRNYRRLAEGDLKRRMRWVSIGVGAGMMPIIAVAPFLIFRSPVVDPAMIARIVNTFTIIIPGCVAYAVLKHRVLGIRVVLRAGLQYVLAKNVLRFALALPAAALGYAVISNPRGSLVDLALGPSGKLNLTMLALGGIALQYRTALLKRIDRRFFREAYKQDQIFLTLTEAVGRAADVGEISRLLSTQIQEALHPRSIFAVSRQGRDEFSVVYSSSTQGGSRTFEDVRLSPAVFDTLESSSAVDACKDLDSETRDYLGTSLGVRLLTPVRGPNEGLVGMILLGEKMSEEPYTQNDRRLLDTVAAQTGIVWENLQLRLRLKQEQDIRKQVVARMDGSAEMVLECPACGVCYDATSTTCEVDGRALTPSLPIARTLDGKYRIAKLIGRGGMGVVYEADDLRLDRRVAVKVTMGALFGDEGTLQRFGREARASAKLDHPNVVRVFDFGEISGGGAYLVLEYLKGSTLRRDIRNRRFTPNQAAEVLLGIFRGIEAAHSRGVIHRDLKPENIFLLETEEGVVPKILDFGLAVVRDLSFSDRNRLTRPGAALGTLAYMSREQFLGEKVDERTDIYALAIVALEILTGEVDHRGPSFSRVGPLVDERLRGEGTTTEHGELGSVLRTALSENREDRYASMREFREALIPILLRCPPLPGWSWTVVPVGVDPDAATQKAVRPTEAAKTERANG